MKNVPFNFRINETFQPISTSDEMIISQSLIDPSTLDNPEGIQIVSVATNDICFDRNKYKITDLKARDDIKIDITFFNKMLKNEVDKANNEGKGYLLAIGSENGTIILPDLDKCFDEELYNITDLKAVDDIVFDKDFYQSFKNDIDKANNEGKGYLLALKSENGKLLIPDPPKCNNIWKYLSFFLGFFLILSIGFTIMKK